MPMTAKRRTNSVVSLCRPSLRILEIRACNRAIFALAFARFADPETTDLYRTLFRPRKEPA